MKKKFLNMLLIFFGSLLFFTFLPQIMPTSVSIAQASEIEKEKNNEYRLNLNTITLVNGKSFTLKVYNLENDAKVSFKSANPEIASVNENGTITANLVGKTTINVTVKRGISSTPLTCEVTVGPPAFSIKTTKSTIILGTNQNYLLDVVMKPLNTAELAKFSSFDSSIASVSSGGRVASNKLGMTYVFAEIDYTNPDGSRKFASCNVIVSKPEEVSLLVEYFNNHYELGMIPEAELSSALYEFFNTIYNYSEDTSATVNTTASETTKEASKATQSAANTSLKTDTNKTSNDTNNSKLSTDASTVKSLPDTATKEPEQVNASTSNNTNAVNASEANENTTPTIIESLDKYLNSKFNLAGLRLEFEESLKPVTEQLQLSSLFSKLPRR